MTRAHAGRAPRARNDATSRARKDTRGSSLSVDDWIAAANDLLVSENIRGVRISALCLKLKVTKGSFYWHFSSRKDLLRALLNSWRRRMTLNIANKLGRLTNGAVSTLRALLMLPRKTFSATGAAVEMSIRDWGRREKLAHDALKEVDRDPPQLFRAELSEARILGARGKAQGICRLRHHDGGLDPQGNAARGDCDRGVRRAGRPAARSCSAERA